ncbi:hypothetical protein [Pseudanabaena sp. FACHB-2040]|uniref:hypothetical protein n=1 Tax=Pseudanabaena sp. FACHB-2040 TaxID=2692859 RepID=UPI00168373EB|nr:hypothetical protein [Pseudanabaena sp. FACHB-2040]MBD2260783.1 hypothetical protein [Pseudanabaena sp. FACHB-2040]
MGIVRMGPPTELISQLRAELSLKNFVETGTYHGNTSAWAANQFEQVYTIENSEPLHKRAQATFSVVKNIGFLLGDSRAELQKILPTLQGKSLFWLDAHWSGGETYGEADQCPLLEEIAVINQFAADSCILIDDARLFTSPPQPPHRLEYWPDIVTVLDSLQQGAIERYIVIIEDVIIAVPSSAKGIVSSYCQQANAKAWKAYGEQQNSSDFQKGLALVSNSLVASLKGVGSRLRSILPISAG